MKKLLIFLLIITGITVILVLLQQEDYTKSSTKLTDKINDTLVKNNVTDKDIISQYRRERRQNNITWIETTREIRLDSKVDISRFKSEFSGMVKLAGYEIYTFNEIPTQCEYIIGKDKKPFQTIIFHHIPVLLVLQAKKKLIAIVIDDTGYSNPSIVKEFINTGIPLTFAIMPGEKFSRQTAELLASLKYPYLLHFPMEPLTYPKDNPGKLALLTTTPDNEIEKMFNKNLKSVISPAGVNNHMGSKFTANERKMKIFLQIVKKNKLFFFDSMTNPKSVGVKLAKQTGVPVLFNEVFLDMVDKPESVEAQVNVLLKTADKRGFGIAIGHIHKKSTLAVLRKLKEPLEKKGYQFVFLTQLLREQKLSEGRK